MHSQPIEVAIGKERHSSALLCLLTKAPPGRIREPVNRSLSRLFSRPLSKSHARASAILFDELDTSHFQRALELGTCLI
jgi:hypothetical protein